MVELDEKLKRLISVAQSRDKDCVFTIKDLTLEELNSLTGYIMNLNPKNWNRQFIRGCELGKDGKESYYLDIQDIRPIPYDDRSLS